MKKAVFTAVLLFFIMLVSVSCGDAESGDSEEGMTVYYIVEYSSVSDYNAGESLIRAVTVTGAENPGTAEAALEALYDDPEDDDLRAPLDDGTEIISFETDGSGASISLSLEEDKDSLELLLMDYCIVLTLAELDGIDSVSIYVNGEAQGLGMTADDVVMSGSESDPFEREICLYYVSESDGFLTSEYHSLTVDDDTLLARYVMEELLRQPISENSYSVIPEGTSLNSISVSEEVCYVDLSGEFISGMPEDEGEARLCVYSIVNSLTEIAEIESVLITVDGETVEWYSCIPLSEPLKKNSSITGPVNTAAGEESVTIYFESERYGTLIPVQVIVLRDSYLSDEETTLQALISAESEPGLISLVPDSTEILSMEVRGMICYIDLSDEFINSREDDSEESVALAVEAVVRVLTENGDISAVKISINGLDDAAYGNIDFSNVITLFEIESEETD